MYRVSSEHLKMQVVERVVRPPYYHYYYYYYYYYCYCYYY